METRLRIIESALELFSARGYEAVSVQEICIASGITKPTLYYYFGSKRGLLAALLERYAGALVAALRGPTTYRGDLTRSLEESARVFFRRAEAEPLFMRLFLALRNAPAESEAAELAAAYLDEVTDNFRYMFRYAAEDHGNMRGREVPYSLSFTGTVLTYVRLILDGRIEAEEDLAHRVVRQFSHGIYS
jgi:TetR/AcrR family transcriptional regulator